MTNPYQQYKEQSLSTLAPGEILVKLYDECVKQLMIAKIHIEKKDFAPANESLGKTQTIINTLADSLDMRYPVSNNLRELYIFLSKEILRCNLKKDTAIIDNCIPLLKDLRHSFDQADKISRRNQHVGSHAV